MRSRLPTILSIAALLLAALSFVGQAGAGRLQQASPPGDGTPSVISYQGTLSGTVGSALGYFKFAILDASKVTVWSNDGTSSAGSQPSTSVPLGVTNGLFNVLLGDTTLSGMTQPLTYTTFATANTSLRIWFSPDNSTFQQQSPDQAFPAVPYALQAGIAKQAEAIGNYGSERLALLGHKHPGSDFTYGVLSVDRLPGSIALLSNILPTVRTSGGAGSGLEGDLLDGYQGSYYTDQILITVTASGFITGTLADSRYGGTYTAGAGLFLNPPQQFNVNFANVGVATTAARGDHKHAGTDITSGTLNSAFIGTDIARVSQITSTVWSQAGPGSGLNADLLDGLHGAAYVALASAQTITGAKTFSPASGSPFTVTSAIKVANLNADLLDGYATGNAAGALPLNNGTLNATLNADQVDGLHISGLLTLTGTQTLTGAPTFSPVSGSPFTVTSATLVANLNADQVDGLDSTELLTIADPQTVTGAKTFSPAGGSPFTVTSLIKVDNLNADLLDGYTTGTNLSGTIPLNNRARNVGLNAGLLDGYHTGTVSGTIPVNNGTLNLNLNADLLNGQHGTVFVTTSEAQLITGTKTLGAAAGAPFGVGNPTQVGNLNADLLDGYATGNSSGNIPINNGTRNVNLNADVLDDRAPGTGDGNIPISNGTRNVNLNADLLDGLQGSAYQKRVTGACAVGSTIQSINADGTVLCETHDTRAPYASTVVNAVDSYSTSVTIGVDGLPLISYYDAANGDLKVIHCSTPACTSSVSATLDSTGNVGAYNSITIGGDGLGLISYYDATNGDLKVAHCTNVVCSSATATTRDSANSVGAWSSITTGADGLGLISYYDASVGKLKVAHCTNTACSAAGATTISITGDWAKNGYGKFTSITINPATGYGVIAFWAKDGTDGNLGYVRCKDPACGTYDSLALESTYDTGYNTSIAVGVDGYIIISYWQYTHGQLRIVHCTNTTCASNNEVVVDDGSGFDTVFRQTALTIGADGMPLILYYDYNSPGNLKVAHCATLSCSAQTFYSFGQPNDSQALAITVGVDGLPFFVYRNTSGYLQTVYCSNTACTPYFRQR
jgi:hypothetical protein